LGSTGLRACRWTRDLGLPSRSAARRRCAASSRGPGAWIERACRGDMGRSGAFRPRRALKLAGACASGTHPACRPNLGSASASTRIGATIRRTGTTARSAELGRDSGSARANLGRATASSARSAAAAARTGRSAGAAFRRTTAFGPSGSSHARSHVGIAAGRVAGAAVFRRRWLGAARAFVGRRPAGSRYARTIRHRLGIAAGNTAGPSPDTTRTVVERACSRLVVGRRQDRGARGSARAVVGRSCRGAFRSDPTRTTSGSRMGAASCCSGVPARAWFSHVSGARRRRRGAGCGGR
jgi:hypothetical protein